MGEDILCGFYTRKSQKSTNRNIVRLAIKKAPGRTGRKDKNPAEQMSLLQKALFQKMIT